MDDYFRKNRYYVQLIGLVVYLALSFWAYTSIRTELGLIRATSLFSLLGLAGGVYVADMARRFSARNNSKYMRVWYWMSIGLLIWLAVEAIWLFFPQAQARGTYSYWADIIWAAGSFPLMRAFALRYSALRPNDVDETIKGVTFSLIGVSAVAFFITTSTLFIFSTADNVFMKTTYAVVYLGLPLFAGLVFFSRLRGRAAAIWHMIAILFFLRGLAGEYFLSYGWYVPLSTQVNAISISVFGGINLLLSINLYLGWLFEQEEGLSAKLKLGFVGQDKDVPKFLLHTNADGVLIHVSDNFLRFANNSLPERFIGKHMREVLHISDEQYQAIHRSCSRGGFVTQQDVRVSAGQKNPVPLLLTAIGSVTGVEYFGMDMVLFLPNYSGQGFALDDEPAAIVQSILNRTGQYTQEDSAALVEYFILQIGALRELIVRYNGRPASAGLENEINAAARKNRWPIQISGAEVKIELGSDNFESAELLTALPTLFQIARKYAVSATSEEMVFAQTKNTDSQVSDRMLETAERFSLR